MNACSVFVTAAALGALTLALAGNGPERPVSADRENLELRNQVNELQRRLKTVETRLSALESTVERLKTWHPLPGSPPLPTPLEAPQPPSRFKEKVPENGQAPKIWGQRDINGWTFYVVPCGQGSVEPSGANPVSSR